MHCDGNHLSQVVRQGPRCTPKRTALSRQDSSLTLNQACSLCLVGFTDRLLEHVWQLGLLAEDYRVHFYGAYASAPLLLQLQFTADKRRSRCITGAARCSPTAAVNIQPRYGHPALEVRTKSPTTHYALKSIRPQTDAGLILPTLRLPRPYMGSN